MTSKQVVNELVKCEPKNEIVVYQPNETMRLEVRVENDTVWLNRQQMAKLFGRDVKTIGKHIANALKEELAPTVADHATVRADGLGGTIAKFATVQAEGGRQVVRMVEHYGLEMITSVGFRVKSPEGVVFRRWANRVLVDMMLQGISVGRKYEALALEMDRRLSKHDADIIELRKDVDFFISSSLPPKEKVFVEGKMLDAQVELTRIVKTAKTRIVLIDNYSDERTLMLLGNRAAKVTCTVYTLRPNSPKLAPALANYAKEYPTLPITVKGYKESHDRFLIVDNTVWHIDAAHVDVGMFYDARIHGMNPIFNDLTGRPLRGYYPFVAWRNLLRLGMHVKTTSDFTNGVWTVAAKGTDGRIGALVVRYTDDDGEYYPKRVTLRLASGASLADATFHMTDRDLVHTAFDPEPNADGSVDVMMYPCSFVLVETKPLSLVSRP